MRRRPLMSWIREGMACRGGCPSRLGEGDAMHGSWRTWASAPARCDCGGGDRRRPRLGQRLAGRWLGGGSGFLLLGKLHAFRDLCRFGGRAPLPLLCRCRRLRGRRFLPARDARQRYRSWRSPFSMPGPDGSDFGSRSRGLATACEERCTTLTERAHLSNLFGCFPLVFSDIFFSAVVSDDCARDVPAKDSSASTTRATLVQRTSSQRPRLRV